MAPNANGSHGAPAGTRALDRAWRGALRVGFRLQLALWYWTRPVIHGAYVAVWHGDRILLIRNSYRKRYSFPAGGLKRGERPVDAAARELAEEVGIAVPSEALRYAGLIVDPSKYAEDHAHVFELRCEAEPELRVDRREVVWARFLSPDEAVERGVVNVVRRYLARELDSD
jgi:8-oxo-dGTP diphosphatase